MNYQHSCYQWHLLHSTTISTRTQINNALNTVCEEKRNCSFLLGWPLATVLLPVTLPNYDQFSQFFHCFETGPLAAEPIEQGRQSPAHFFLYAMGKYSCLPYHFSASKLIFFFHFILNTCRQWMPILLSFLKPWQNSIFSWKKCRQLLQQSPQAPTTHFATDSTAPKPPFLPSHFKWPSAAYVSTKNL